MLPQPCSPRRHVGGWLQSVEGESGGCTTLRDTGGDWRRASRGVPGEARWGGVLTRDCTQDISASVYVLVTRIVTSAMVTCMKSTHGYDIPKQSVVDVHTHMCRIFIHGTLPKSEIVKPTLNCLNGFMLTARIRETMTLLRGYLGATPVGKYMKSTHTVSHLNTGAEL